MPHSVMMDLPGLIIKQPVISEIKDERFKKKHIRVSMLRLDEVHPVISGNKLFKLFYFLQEAKKSFLPIITFGGAYSNHLAATAFACHKMNLKSIGIVRGEMPPIFSHTLLFCREQGMELIFLSREEYKKSKEKSFLQKLTNRFGEHILVPEGGFSIKGKLGAMLIAEYFSGKNFTHISTPVGTATTFAGIIDAVKNDCEVIGFSVLKNLFDINERLTELEIDPSWKYSFNGNYHFGGYAKRAGELILFMNEFYEKNKIPLDFVYTAKMMFGVNDLISKNFFPQDSNILCLHTGGLQGNQSLPKGLLNF